MERGENSGNYEFVNPGMLRTFTLWHSLESSEYLDSDHVIDTPWATQHSDLHFCEVCGRVYGQVEVEGKAWTSWKGVCDRCPSPHTFPVPGSLWKSWDHDYLASLPLAVLVREFELHYKHFLGE